MKTLYDETHPSHEYNLLFSLSFFFLGGGGGINCAMYKKSNLLVGWQLLDCGRVNKINHVNLVDGSLA